MKRISLTAKYIFLILFAFFSVFPFFWMIVSATNTSMQIMLGKLSIGDQFLINLRNAFDHADLITAFINSLELAIIITVLSLLVSSVAGYAFAIYPTRARNFLFVVIIASLMVPFAAKLIPLFRMFSSFKWISSKMAIILPAVSAPFLIFFFKQNTMAFPVETIQSARVDGLNEVGIFFRIYMPMMKSTYAAAAIFTFMSSWNNYLWPLVILHKQQDFTLPLVVSSMASLADPDYGMVMIGILLSTVPTMVFFFFMQRHFVDGIVGSAK